jgi:hypothetical protein
MRMSGTLFLSHTFQKHSMKAIQISAYGDPRDVLQVVGPSGPGRVVQNSANCCAGADVVARNGPDAEAQVPEGTGADTHLLLAVDSIGAAAAQPLLDLPAPGGHWSSTATPAVS